MPPVVLVFGGLLARNGIVDIDSILKVGNSELIERRIVSKLRFQLK